MPLWGWVISVVTLVSLGCGTSALRHMALTNDLPSDMPKSVRDKFEIRDTTKDQTLALIEQTQVDEAAKSHSQSQSKNKKKKSKGKESRDLASAKVVPTNTPFVYPVRRPDKDAFWVGERLTYAITYLGVSAGDFTLEVLPFKQVSTRKVFHIRGTAVTSDLFSIFYRVHDRVESFIDYEGTFSHRFHILLDETRQTREAIELNDSEKKQTYYWNHWDHKVNGLKVTNETAEIQPFSQDSVSALYYVRTVPLPTGAVFTFPVISEGKTWEAVVTVVRREEMSTPMGRKMTVVLQPEMKYQGILKKSGDSYLWLTDDEHRIPVRLEAKVKIGTVVGRLKKVELGKPPEVVQTSAPSQLPSSSPSGSPVSSGDREKE